MIPLRHVFQDGVLEICLFKAQARPTLTFTMTNGDVYETNEYSRVVNINGSGMLKTIFHNRPTIAIHDAVVDIYFTENGENVSAKLPKRVDLIRDLNKKLDAMSARIVTLEAESKLEHLRSLSIITILLSAGFEQNDIINQIPLLLALTRGTNLSDLTINASASVAWESDVFEQLIAHGYDPRKCHGVEQEIIDIIDMNWLYAWYPKHQLMFARIITLASIDWSNTSEKNINWKRIVAEFEIRNGCGPRDSDNITSMEATRWKESADKLRAAIQAQINSHAI